ncbi:MAG: response regulator [Phycisphaerales bacterium]|nr:response regulator [Phycisphaerales bacterium]
MTRIAIIDDDPNVLSAVRRCLRRSGYESSTHDNPRHALRSFSTTWPDLVLLDVSMPMMSGHEVLRRLRRLESKRRRCGTINSALPTPVIFLTGLAATHQVVAGLDAGVSDYVTKPFDDDELRARIRHQLRLARNTEERIAAAESTGSSAIHDIASAIQSCDGPLLELDFNLTLANVVRRDSLQKQILGRAHANVAEIINRLSHANRNLGDVR